MSDWRSASRTLPFSTACMEKRLFLPPISSERVKRDDSVWFGGSDGHCGCSFDWGGVRHRSGDTQPRSSCSTARSIIFPIRGSSDLISPMIIIQPSFLLFNPWCDGKVKDQYPLNEVRDRHNWIFRLEKTDASVRLRTSFLSNLHPSLARRWNWPLLPDPRRRGLSNNWS